MKHNLQQDLQISEFIKDPASLKLLILAGTKIKPQQIATVNKCTSLIKLDLSSNNLFELPLKFGNFPIMRILYLHDNQLTDCPIINTNLEYISLFDNPIQNYRSDLIEHNSKLVAIDCNVITPDEKVTLYPPKEHTELKWPIVEISQELQHEEDYLNLLKAELFVIGQVYKKATSIDKINKYLRTVKELKMFKVMKHKYTNQSLFRVQSVRKAAIYWIKYAAQKKKLKRILAGSQVEKFTWNRIERAKASRSKGVGEVMIRFTKSLRARVWARKILQKGLRNYRLQIPVFQHIEEQLIQDKIIFFKESQLHLLNKVMLYAKKLFFSKKEYDLCDNFDKLIQRGKKVYYIFKARGLQGQTMLQDMLKMSMGLILCEKGVDRKALLYNKRGHKGIQIKRVRKMKMSLDKDKMEKVDARLDRLYTCYDTLVSMEFKNSRLFSTILHLLRYFNSGNAQKIEQNKAAYFQTEVIFDQPQKSSQKRGISFSSCELIKRSIAANIIQKTWRRYSSLKRLNRNILTQIREDRAKKLIGRWVRDITFRHRMQLTKTHSFLKSVTKEQQLYLQMDIYMNLPASTNILKYPLQRQNIQEGQDLYQIIHQRSEIQIVQLVGRSWLKIRYLDCQEAVAVRKKLSVLSYRYFFNGFHIQLFTLSELHRVEELNGYQKKVSRLFGIKVKFHEQMAGEKVKKIEVENTTPFFIWPFVEQGFASMFKPQQIQSLPISVFIYNKNRRPLKVNCDLLWVLSASLYFYRKRPKTVIRVKTPKKEIQQTIDLYMMPHIRHKMNRQRQFSMKQHKSLLQANRQRGHSELVQLSLLSETLNIKRQ